MIGYKSLIKSATIRPRHLFVTILAMAIGLYALFQARFLILGPQVKIVNLEDGDLVKNSLVILEGEAKNISWISLNGRQIFTNEKGFWSEKLLVSPGLSTVTVTARDRFGREKSKSVRLVLNTKEKRAVEENLDESLNDSESLEENQ
jgi:hypothetical protein